MSHWRLMESAPKDGSHILAWARMVADELDEDDRVIVKDKVEHYAVIVYWCFGCFMEFPYRGSIPTNVRYTHWQPLPRGPC